MLSQQRSRTSCSRLFSSLAGSATASSSRARPAASMVCSTVWICARKLGVPPTPSNACTRSSSAASRPSACCPVPRPPRCCSGRSSPWVRSPCAGSTAGKPSSTHPPTLTSLPEPTHHALRNTRRTISTNFATRPRGGWIHVSSATPSCCAKASKGVWKARHLRGVVLKAQSKASRS